MYGADTCVRSKLAGEGARATRYVIFSPTDFACENSSK